MDSYTDPNAPIQNAPPAGKIVRSKQVTPEQAQAQGFDLSGEHLNAPPPGEQPQSSGGSLTDSWNSFIDHPENRAGMMQFAVNMLAGRGFAESLGGAAEATGRNVTAQEEAAKTEEEMALKEQEAARKERETDYYGIAARKKSGMDTFYERQAANEEMKIRAEQRKGFTTWLGDITQPGGPLLSDVQKKFPNIKSKDDLAKLGNEAALEYAAQRHAAVMGGGVAAPPRAGGGGGFQAPPGTEARMGKDGKIHLFDAKTHKYLRDAN